MRIARLATTDGPRYAVWTGAAWAVVEAAFADPENVATTVDGIGSLTNTVV